MARSTRKTVTWAVLGSAACAAAALLARRNSPRFRLDGKVVFVTGGSRGLGLLLAREFMDRGAKVAVCARDEQELTRAREEFAPVGDRFLAIQCDLADNDQVVFTLETIEKAFGPIDVLVNNAGAIQVGPLENQRLDDFYAAMRTNFWSAVHTTLAVLPGMKHRGNGRVVNITSIGGKIAVPHLLPYSASKFALVGFSKGLRAELAKDGISVTTIVPGLMRTGSPRNVETVGQHEKEYSWFAVGDSLPGVSMDAKRAARKIVDACVAGSGEVVLGAAAHAMAVFEALAPNTVSAILAAVNEWMLPPPGDDSRKKKGFKAENPIARSVLTSLTRDAELKNNEV
ncbi:MAG: SDR family NAD(P)-dependent oxidoreductase [Candidatus Acidiferrales bacterium]